MDENSRASFVRQRRNLVAVSILLLIAQQTAITISEVNLLGNHFQLTSQYGVAAILWIPALYWALRYYQATRDLGSLGFHDAVLVRLNRTLLPRAAFRKYIASHQLPPELSDQSRRGVKYKLEHVERVALAGDGHKVDIAVSWIVPILDGWQAGSTPSPMPVYLDAKEERWLRARAWVHLFLNTSLFTEYLLPPLLFLAAILQWVSQRLA